MRILLAMTGLVLLISGAVIGVGANQQPALDTTEAAVVSEGEQLAIDELTVTSAGEDPASLTLSDDVLFAKTQQVLNKTAALQTAADPDAQDPPDGEEPDGEVSDARQTVEALMAQAQAMIAAMEENEAEMPPAVDDLEEGDPYPVEQAQDPTEPAEDVVEVEQSPAQRVFAELMARAQELIDRLTESEEAEEQATEPETEAGDLLDQVQNLLAQIGGQDVDEDQAIVQEWMPSRPDCDADAAPRVNWSGCDMSGLELHEANLQGANLMDTNFSGAILSNTDMSGAHLGGANFSGAELSSVLLRKSNLADVDFSGSLLLFVDMSYSDISSADFSDSSIAVVLALHSKLVKADFSDAGILFSDFSYSDLSGALFTRAQVLLNFLRKSIFKDADFSETDLFMVDLDGAGVQGMDLSGAKLRYVWFKGTDGEPTSSVDLNTRHIICPDGSYSIDRLTTDVASLCDWTAGSQSIQTVAAVSEPDCSLPAGPGINWSGCDKSNRVYRGVDLSDAILVGTNFSGTTFKLVDLRGADMNGANLDGSWFLFSNLSGVNLSEASMFNTLVQNADMSSVDLSEAKATQASIFFATMRHSSMSKADMSGGQLEIADLSYANMNEFVGTGMEFSINFMHGANLTGANLSQISSIGFVDMSSAQIEAFDLSADGLDTAIWFKGANGVPTSSQDLFLDGTAICPAGDAVTGPLTTDAASLCQWKACWAGIVDGDFETDSGAWYLPATEYTAAFSKDQAKSPGWSVRTGIIDDDNVYSFSSVRQRVTIPAGTKPAVLTFYLYPQTDEPLNYLIPSSLEEAMTAKDANPAMGGPGSKVGDAQWVIILDSMGYELMRPVSMRSNSRTWEYYEVDLSHLAHPYKDRTIEVYFGTFNNGYAGLTGMYVDDVALGSCPGVAPPPPPEPPPQVCSDIVVNGDFELKDGWMLPLTPKPAGYSDKQVYNGVQAMRTGIYDVNGNVESFSSAAQKVTIPADATTADLEFYLYPQSTEAYDMLIPESMEEVIAPGAKAMNYGDAQWAMLLNRKGQQIARLVSMRSNEKKWGSYSFDLLPYKGHTILLYFSSYNNGWDGRTSMFIDDVSLNVCAPETTKPAMALTEMERGE